MNLHGENVRHVRHTLGLGRLVENLLDTTLLATTVPAFTTLRGVHEKPADGTVGLLERAFRTCRFGECSTTAEVDRHVDYVIMA